MHTFMNDNDGFSLADFICVSMFGTFIFCIIFLLFFVAFYHGDDFEIRYKQLYEIIKMMKEPVMLIVGAHFTKKVIKKICKTKLETKNKSDN